MQVEHWLKVFNRQTRYMFLFVIGGNLFIATALSFRIEGKSFASAISDLWPVGCILFGMLIMSAAVNYSALNIKKDEKK